MDGSIDINADKDFEDIDNTSQVFFSKILKDFGLLDTADLKRGYVPLDHITQSQWERVFEELPVVSTIEEYISLCTHAFYAEVRSDNTRMFKMMDEDGSWLVLGIFSQPDLSSGDIASQRKHRDMQVFLQIIRNNLDQVSGWYSNVQMPHMPTSIREDMIKVFILMQTIPVKYCLTMAVHPRDGSTPLELRVLAGVIQTVVSGVLRIKSPSIQAPNVSKIVTGPEGLAAANRNPMWQEGHFRGKES